MPPFRADDNARSRVGRTLWNVAKRRDGQPDKFQWDGFPIDDRPADPVAATSAIKRLVSTFVIASKRERVLAMLLHKDRNKRNEAIQTVYKWIGPKLQSELEGNTGFPQHLKERFGDLRGIIIDEAKLALVMSRLRALLSSPPAASAPSSSRTRIRSRCCFRKSVHRRCVPYDEPRT